MKFYKHYSIVLISLTFMLGCGSSIDTAKLSKTKQLVDSRKFEIQNEWVIPMGGGRINLIGNPNFIRFKNDSVNVFLPFFGERFAGGGYNGEGAITYNGLLKDLEISSDERDTIIINFSTDQDTEDLDFTITIYPEGKVNTRVNSSHRSFISYQGEIGELKKND